MELRLICLGKTNETYIQKGIDEYFKRLKHYVKFSIEYLPHPKVNGTPTWDDLKKAEGEVIFKVLNGEPFILFDELGETYNSMGFAKYLQGKFNKGGKRINFVIGGAYGFSKKLYQQSSGKLALSKLTFSHQLVRLIAMEQFYRAMTILKGEKYHH